MHMRPGLTILILFLFIASSLTGQETAVVKGNVRDESYKPLEFVNIAISGLPGGAISDEEGNFELTVPCKKEIIIVITSVGFNKEAIPMTILPGEKKFLRVTLHESATELPSVIIEDLQTRQSTLVRLNPKITGVIPGVSDGIPAILKTLPGVSSNNELSSQYNVRGGNFDENLVYVNDIEIYRPFLIRSGQQEGLSFVNSDLVSSILFSAGGFEARYGDKMSSVLDIQYKKPQEFGGSASFSLLGGSFHIEGTAFNKKTSYLVGFRNKTNQYLLNSLETKGEYKPSFSDLQALINIQASKKFEFSVLANYSKNLYKLVPENRETQFGTYQMIKKIMVYFDGQESDNYDTYLCGFTATFKPSENIKLSLLSSAYQADENETYDIMGQYFIGQLETNTGSDNYGNVTETEGVGTFLNHARNRLKAQVFNIGHRGTVEGEKTFLQWGLQVQQENIDDHTNEWVMIDSAGYSVPRPPDSIGYTNPGAQPYIPFELYDLILSNYELSSKRYTAFIQNKWSLGEDNKGFHFTAGVRANYWDYNEQLLVSPRASVAYVPDWSRDILFRLSAGYYYQPPFYRELKDMAGSINPDIKAQKSIHFVAGTDINFISWSRPFKFTGEAYYKYLDNLIPYIVDNVRIRYMGNNNAHGYATGLDFKVNGEFVKGAESWASLSIMRTREDIEDDFYIDKDGNKVEPGYIPRPADQRVNFSIFFQDYLPRNPSYKMSLTLIFGSGLPFGPTNSPKYKHTLRIPPYRRVDIGFSKEIISENKPREGKSPLKYLKSLWFTAEVLNLLQVSNTVSYIWVTDIYGSQYAVPNYLTPRQLNAKLIAKF